MLNWLISGLGAGLLKGEITARLERAGRRVAMTVLALVLWLVAVGFALGALVTWLAGEVGPVAACGIVAGVFAIIAIIIQITMRLSHGSRPHAQPSPLLSGLGASEDLPNAGPIGLVAVIALLGYLLGRQTRRR